MTTATKMSELMDAKRDKARAEIRRLLWDGAPLEKAVDAAIAGGLGNKDVDQIQCEVDDGKATIAKLATFDLGALKSEASKTKAAYEKLLLKLERLEEETSCAGRANAEAVEALDTARHAFEQAASRVSGGELPADGLPEMVHAIIEYRRLDKEVLQTEQKCKSLKHEIGRAEDRVAHMQKEHDKLRAQRSTEHSVRMMPLADEYAASIKTLTGQIKQAKERSVELEKELTDLRAAHKKARAALPW